MQILFEDTDVVAVYKPAGMLVHPDGVHQEKMVSDWMEQTYPEAKGVGEPLTLKDGTSINRSGVVHRIDADTSGVLLLAKNQKAYEFLKEQFQNRTIEKTYYAFIYSTPKEKEGIITAPIGRSAKYFHLRSAQRGARGALREAVTHYCIEKENDTYAYVRLSPKTGRTHQLRVHMKYIHHPIVCDPLYAPNQECGLGFSRIALHASSIRFTLPSGGEQHVEAPLPEDFTKALSYF